MAATGLAPVAAARPALAPNERGDLGDKKMSDSSEVILLVAAVAGVAALFATKPSVTDINERVDELIYEEVRSAKTDNILGEVMQLA